MENKNILIIAGILIVGALLIFKFGDMGNFSISDSSASGEFSFVGISPEGEQIFSQNNFPLFSIFSRSCTPLGGYDSCWEEAYDSSYGDAYAEAFVRMHWTNIRCNGPECYMDYKFEGDIDKTYVYVNRANTWEALWDYADCESSFEDRTDCRKGDGTLSGDQGRYYFTRDEGDTYTDCPVFVFLDHDNDEATNGDWAYAVAMAGYGWLGTGNCLNLPYPYTPPCIEDWQCSSWGNCVAGTKNRQCTDMNSCGTEESKPEESIQCVVECRTDADTNCDGTIQREELGDYISMWLFNQINREELSNVIQEWSNEGVKHI